MALSGARAAPEAVLDPSDHAVLRCVYEVSSSGRGADEQEVRDLLVLCHRMSAAEAVAAIARAEAKALISFREADAG